MVDDRPDRVPRQLRSGSRRARAGITPSPLLGSPTPVAEPAAPAARRTGGARTILPTGRFSKLAQRVLREFLRGFAIVGCLQYPTAESMALARQLMDPDGRPQRKPE